MSEPPSETPFEAPSIESIAELMPAYQFDSLIAQGGMGAVYRARQISLDRDVAVKILPRELSEDPEFRASFRAEAKAMARLIHPNLIGVFDSGNVGGLLYIVMELVPGKSLFHSAYHQAIDAKQAAEIVIGVCKGLAHAHENGIIHRDIKPANILLTPKREPKIGDFGLARSAGPDSQGLVMGTPGYTAPEVISQPDETDKSSDIFSIGVVLRELLTGADPVSGESGAAITDPILLQICNKATHQNPAARFSDALAMASALENWMKNKASDATPASYVPPAPHFDDPKKEKSPAFKYALILSAVAIGAGIIWLVMAQKECPGKAPLAAIATPDSGIPPVPGEAGTNEDLQTDQAPQTAEYDHEALHESLKSLRGKLRSGKRDEMPDGTITVGDHLYLFVNSPMSWPEAQRFAGNFAAHLPLISSQSDLDWLKSQRPDDPDHEEMWVGARAYGSVWQSVDARPWTHKSFNGSGSFGAMTKNGILVAREIKVECPFFIQWRRDGTNRASLGAMLKQTADTLDSPNPIFPVGTIHRENRRALIVKRKVNADQARQLAELGGGRLMEPCTEEDADWLDQRLGKNSNKNGFWLGGQLRGADWTWLSGAEWGFSRWSDGCPTETGDALAYLPDKGWTNVDSSEKRNGLIIEWDLKAAPVKMTKAPEPTAPATEKVAIAPAPVEKKKVIENPLTIKAGDILRTRNQKRTAALKANAREYSFKLEATLKRTDNQASTAERERAIKLISADKTSHRIPRGIPTSPNATLTEDVLNIVQTHLSLQKEIDDAFLAKADTVRKFYLTNLKKEADEIARNGDKEDADDYAILIADAADTESWVSSFDGISFEQPDFQCFIIASAIFGIDDRTADVTDRFIEFFHSGKAPFTVDSRTLEVDPQPGVTKPTTVEFVVNGASVRKVFVPSDKIQPTDVLQELGLNPAAILLVPNESVGAPQ